ncbi:1-aminocyclopropane-1-carboxylate synthase-like protein 1 isoform X2 [Stegodyphus dumicola]|uniref:1-aminocyclopropane-1-carboxylate synthase-like protein 1 isoform X2 n=1 Tax=Stegodyphus dumicola TaxID=202533 RepID=UPI0015B1EFD7|nr:1-aminocyclopropane-1-carboxylate synthase-like protein 1 isoform X2 [Stegodyphus dumicola]
MATYLSKRADAIKNWEDFLDKYLGICIEDEYDKEKNPEGYVDLATAVNNLCPDIIYPKLASKDVWYCDPAMLQYREDFGIMRLRKAMASLMTVFLETHKPIEPTDLVCSAGVTSCIDLLSHCIADPGDVILAPTPIYSRIYTDFKQRAEVDLWPIPIISKDNEELKPVLTIEKVEKAYAAAISQNRVVRGIFLINPDNPLGDVYSPELVMDILKFAQKHKLHAIVDELYALSVFPDGPQFHSVLKFPEIPDPERTHILYGLSKDFGLAGLRIGVIYTQCKELRNCLIQLTAFASVPYPIMDIAARLLEDIDWCKAYVAEFKKRLQDKFTSCSTHLKKLGINVRDSKAGLFLWMDFRHVCGSKSFKQERDFFLYLLNEMHLYIVPGEELFSAQPGWFRMIFTGHPNNLNEGLRRLEQAIQNYKPLDL